MFVEAVAVLLLDAGIEEGEARGEDRGVALDRAAVGQLDAAGVEADRRAAATAARSSSTMPAAGVKVGKRACQFRTLPPSTASRSITTGCSPASARLTALRMPAMPPPMMRIRFVINRFGFV